MSNQNFVYKRNVSDDEDSMVSKCFAISSDVQMKEIPTNGEEYLLRVIKERQNYSAVTICQKDYTKFAKKQTCFVKEEPNAVVPKEFKPTIEWQNIQVADFSETRLYLNSLKAKKSLCSKHVLTHNFHYTNPRQWRHFLIKNEPTLSCVLGLPLVAIDYGIEYLTEVIAATNPGKTIDHKTGQWTYALLACIRQPLLSDTTSILRNLARKCADVRSHINPDDENARSAVAPLNLFICLVARYFRQYDLAD